MAGGSIRLRVLLLFGNQLFRQPEQSVLKVESGKAVMPAFQHFHIRVFQRPSATQNSKHRNQNTGTIGSVKTMHEDRIVFLVINYFQKLIDIVFCWQCPVVEREIVEVDSHVRDDFAFASDVPFAPSERDHRSDVQFFKLGKSLFARLRAAIQPVVDLVEIADWKF